MRCWPLLPDTARWIRTRLRCPVKSANPFSQRFERGSPRTQTRGSTRQADTQRGSLGGRCHGERNPSLHSSLLLTLFLPQKLLRGHKHIVNLIEASAAPIPGTPGYEVFILMEYCAGGGIIDMMNTRLQNRLTEAEVLKIFADVVEAVCWMHTRSPPLMHRDLKVENILLAGPDFYKVCDFGSATTPKRAPQSMQEIQALEAELNKTTTLQYRAPEMCDVWSRKEVGLPAGKQ